MMSAPTHILFVCTGNTCRSPMAEGLFRQLAAQNHPDWVISSAGISAWTGDTASEHTLEALRRHHIDLSSHRSTAISPQLIDAATHIYTMTSAHRDILLAYFPEYEGKIHLLTYLLDSADIADPFGGPLSLYQKTLQQMLPALQSILTHLESPTISPS